MGFLRSLFSKSKTEPTTRQLSQPQDLLVGDLITLDDSFALPSQLKGQQLRVEAIHTYEYEHKQVTEWQLKGASAQAIHLSLDIDDDIYLAFALKITREQVEQLFDLDVFSNIFEEPGQAEIPVNTAHGLSELIPWLGEHYRQNRYAELGYFHRLDLRKQTTSAQGETLESYQLIDDSEQYAIDIEVYDGGETEVSLILYRPLTDIREYWPAS